MSFRPSRGNTTVGTPCTVGQNVSVVASIEETLGFNFHVAPELRRLETQALSSGATGKLVSVVSIEETRFHLDSDVCSTTNGRSAIPWYLVPWY